MYRFLLLLIVTSFLALNCSEKSSTDSGEPTFQYQKSAKRGLAYNLMHAADIDTLKKGVSWWYNWYYRTDAPDDYYRDYQLEFIPMLWVEMVLLIF